MVMLEKSVRLLHCWKLNSLLGDHGREAEKREFDQDQLSVPFLNHPTEENSSATT